MFMFSFSAFATGEVDTATEIVEDIEPTQVVEEPTEAVTIQPTQAIQEDNEYDEEPENDEYEDENIDNEYIEEVEEETQPQTYYEVYSDQLPQVESQDVTQPTTVEIPEVEVTDTSLIGGVIAWLCVAVGIAVIAGVLVSQRTRQSNSQAQNRDNRRR